jgi:hypothetical protein
MKFRPAIAAQSVQIRGAALAQSAYLRAASAPWIVGTMPPTLWLAQLGVDPASFEALNKSEEC